MSAESIVAIDDCLTCDGYVLDAAQWPLCPSCHMERKQQPMMIKCGWCGKVMRDGSEPASHGMCEDCQGTMMAEAEARR